MKNSYLAAILLLVTSLYSCSGNDERDPNYLEINGNQRDINVGYIQDSGTDYNITYRKYNLDFSDSENYASNYLILSICSFSTQRLEEGTYSYQYIYQTGYFSDIEVGWDISYDSNGVATSGNRIHESQMSNKQGTVVVSMKDGDYCFDVDFSFDYNGQEYHITTHYWDVLKSYSNY